MAGVFSKSLADILSAVVEDDDYEEFMTLQRRKRRRLRCIAKGIESLLTSSAQGDPLDQRGFGVRDYVERTVPGYSEVQFKEHFRMYRPTFEMLYNFTRAKVKENTNRVPLRMKMLMTLWLMGNQESYRGVADRFGVNRGTLHYIVEQMVVAWQQRAGELIMWPQDIQQVAQAFFTKWKFPGVVGAVDGSHIEIKAPKEEQWAYYNRKDVHSVIIQGCCDAEMCFTHVFIGKPGRMHDARVFAASGLEEILGTLPPENHVLGDSAYPLRSYVMKPYRDSGHLTDAQKRFNARLSSARAVIERAFGRLKGKFRRLKYLDMSRMDLIPVLIGAACMLHNFILKNPSELDDDDDDYEEPHREAVHSNDNEESDLTSEEKRDNIAACL